MEDAILLEEVSALLSAAESCMQKANGGQTGTQLIRQGFRNPQSLYKAAHRDLKVLRCQQELPFSVEVESKGKQKQSAELADIIGSMDNVLGITGASLSASVGSRLHTEAKAMYADLLTEIDLWLEDRTNWLSDILECQGGVADEAALLIDTVEALQQQHLANLLGLAEDIKYYVELLSSFLEQQAKFVQGHKLTSQKEIDLGESSCLVAASKTQALKIHVIEQRLLNFTYTGQTMPALRAVSQHLDKAEAEANARHEQLSAQLGQYECLGPDFKAQTLKYKKLLEELRHAEFSLQELQANARTANESP